MKGLKREDFEVMAPVGSYESLQAAIQGGADSVYFGIEQLNMRSRSSNNFSTEDLRKIVSIAKENGIKTYLTVNVVIFNNELSLMREIIDVAKEMEVTAIIASDQAAINYAHQIGVEVHISTQVNISNVETLKFYSHFADVVVLARELNMDQVKSIHQAIVEEDIRGPKGELIQIEMFAHGALCMATSGKCYISLHQLNSSANRGGCLQPCRRGYDVTEKESGMQMSLENEYIMSPKDLKTIHFLNKMIDAGVRVFKIEGRARSAEYVKNVCQSYSEAISAVLDGTYGEEKIQQWDTKLSEVFNRGFWDGYYMGQRLGEWSHNYGSRATKKKTYIGKGMNYFPKLGVAEFLMETQNLKVGDEILITGPTTGVVQMKVSEIRVDLNPVEETKKGERFSMPVDVKIRRSDKLYKLTETLNNQSNG
ncbi:peptidase U32 family protein [Carboxylicivirga linearis]|uniref:U32 family peptidase n=1 Tax=Carboxylicivirga linearis TaxID=1628157 RepID=A0ABS5JQM1_9BACT|nr:peptidase U32 family protein [Carboxylicivirga linearis]MBS2096701.1 U32 family peptidase [Carboxylicivirga linearis]